MFIVCANGIMAASRMSCSFASYYLNNRLIIPQNSCGLVAATLDNNSRPIRAALALTGLYSDYGPEDYALEQLARNMSKLGLSSQPMAIMDYTGDAYTLSPPMLDPIQGSLQILLDSRVQVSGTFVLPYILPLVDVEHELVAEHIGIILHALFLPRRNDADYVIQSTYHDKSNPDTMVICREPITTQICDMYLTSRSISSDDISALRDRIFADLDKS